MKRPIALGLALLLAACAGSQGAGSPAEAGSSSSAPTTAVPSGSPRPRPTPAPALSDLLPIELDGVEAHTFPVAQDLLARLAAAAEIALDSLEVAYASEHGARFIQVLAIRVPDMPADRSLELLPEVAYPPIAIGALEVGTDTVAGVEVVTVHNPELASRLGTYYGLVRGGALIVVETFAREDAEAAIDALP